MGTPQERRPAGWLCPGFVARHRAALNGYNCRLTLFGSPPSLQENLLTLEVLRRQLGCSGPHSEPPYDTYYPYLDRDLLEFLYAIPREQLVRPGQRRSLMRRALVGIVPDEILNRKRKAFIARAPMAAIAAEWARLAGMCQNMVTSSLRIVDPTRFHEALRMARHGRQVPMIALVRTLALESWLRAATDRGLFGKFTPADYGHIVQSGGRVVIDRLTDGL